jgi:hypothetical protein
VDNSISAFVDDASIVLSGSLSLFFIGVAKPNFARTDQSFIALRHTYQFVYSVPSIGTDSWVRASLCGGVGARRSERVELIF